MTRAWQERIVLVMTNTPSERDGEPLGPPSIDETHTFDARGRYFLGEAFKNHIPRSVPFRRGLGRGFMISTSNAGPIPGWVLEPGEVLRAVD